MTRYFHRKIAITFCLLFLLLLGADIQVMADDTKLPASFHQLVITEDTFSTLFHQSYFDENKITANCSSERKKIISKIESALKKEPSYISVYDGGLLGEDYYGVTSEPRGYLYYGKVKDNRPNGFGVLTGYSHETSEHGYVSHEYLVYAGEFKKGIYNGYGVAFEEPSFEKAIDISDPINQGSYVKYDGEWKDGVECGKGNEYVLNENTRQIEAVVVSNFKKGLYEGKTKIYNVDGTLKFEGNCKKGEPSGKGIHYFDDGKKHYDGEWKDGKYHGKGKLYDKDGKVIYNGKWKFGEYAS